MKINLTTAERIKTNGLLNEFRGSLENLAIILEDIKQFRFSEEEKKEINLEIRGNMITWNPTKEVLKEFNLQDTTVDYLKRVIMEREFGVDDYEVVTSLKKKLVN